MVDHGAYDTRGTARVERLRSAHALHVPSRVFAAALGWAMLGAGQWVVGFAIATPANKLIGACIFALSCLVATGALLYAEQNMSDGEASG